MAMEEGGSTQRTKENSSLKDTKAIKDVDLVTDATMAAQQSTDTMAAQQSTDTMAAHQSKDIMVTETDGEVHGDEENLIELAMDVGKEETTMTSDAKN
ncbi:Y-box factor [Biomphalaria pfeifferi]|uniref:Y-box factor n=1 Tax=Biomphalaria pfeifferi TaxID=112525 RepID=A0AAD8C142_BIOPF|nr:Y-box factor [Biomphalaria pfeifferi]